MTRYPPPLKPGATIGYFSSSAPVTATNPNRYTRARGYLESKGYTLVSGSLTGRSDHYRSGSIRERAEEFNALIRNPDIDVVMSTIGGQNSNALLPYLDYDALIKKTKIIIGLSDATALLLGIYHKTGLVTFYGPALATGFGEFAPLVDVTYACFKDVLAPQGHAHYTYIQPKEWTDEMIDWESQDRPKRCQANHVEFAGHGRVSGRLIGGNLNTMWSIWGSPYMPEIKTGDILLIEDSFKHISTVERLFMFLRLNGIFDRVSAIVLGKHEQFDDAGSGRKPITVLQEVLDGLSVPIVSDFDCAHTHPILTMPIGGQACIDFDAETVTLKAPWTAT